MEHYTIQYYTMLVLLSFRRRLGARIAELESELDSARSRASKFEKEKNKLSIEIREITIELETVSTLPYSFGNSPISELEQCFCYLLFEMKGAF